MTGHFLTQAQAAPQQQLGWQGQARFGSTTTEDKGTTAHNSRVTGANKLLGDKTTEITRTEQHSPMQTVPQGGTSIGRNHTKLSTEKHEVIRWTCNEENMFQNTDSDFHGLYQCI